jgi:hypothetical protein
MGQGGIGRTDRPKVGMVNEDITYVPSTLSMFIAGRARMIRNQGAADVRARQTASGIHFFEETPIGSLAVTTVFYPPRS